MATNRRKTPAGTMEVMKRNRRQPARPNTEPLNATDVKMATDEATKAIDNILSENFNLEEMNVILNNVLRLHAERVNEARLHASNKLHWCIEVGAGFEKLLEGANNAIANRNDN